MLARITIIAVSFVLFACALTETSSFTDPATLRKPAPTSILVMGGGLALNDKLAAEKIMADKLSARGVRAIRAVDLLPPTRTFTPQEIDALIAREKVNAILVLTMDEKGSGVTYMPQTTVPGQTTGTASVRGDTLYYQSQTSPSYSYGGYGAVYPTGIYSARLYEAATQSVLWTATGNATGWANQKHSDMIPDIASSVVSRLISDKIVAR